MFREVFAGLALVWGHGLACANGSVAPTDADPRGGGNVPTLPITVQDEPPSPRAVVIYLAEVLTPGHRARRLPSGYAVLDASGRVIHTTEFALTSHQCWKIKDGYQCRSTVRTTTTSAQGRARSSALEVTNDYQWRGGRLFSARFEGMRPQTLAQASDDAAGGTHPAWAEEQQLTRP